MKMTTEELLEKLTVDYKSKIESFENTIKEQNILIKELQETIKDLKSQLNKNSKNSSKPSSKDSLNNKPKTKSTREKTGKNKGGQKGKKGNNIIIPDNIKETVVVKHMPSKCDGCEHNSECQKKSKFCDSRYVIDIPVDLYLFEHQTLSVSKCKLTGENLKAEFPENVSAYIQYGENLQTLAVSLNTLGTVSLQRSHELLSGIYGINISPSTIYNMVKKCASKTNEILDVIKQNLIDSDVVHFDETGLNVNSKNMWVHCASNNLNTLLTIHESRGVEGINHCGVLPKFKGIAIHDCWKPYFKDCYLPAGHGVCNTHIIRNLNGVFENFNNLTWANEFKKFLINMNNTKKSFIFYNIDCISDSLKIYFSNKYDELIALAKSQNPTTKSIKNSKSKYRLKAPINLANRLEKYKVEVLRFIFDFTVPFDNNQAERDIRMIKVKDKVAGCFRTKEGAEFYLKIMSCIGTAHKRGHNAFITIKNIIQNNPQFIFS